MGFNLESVRKLAERSDTPEDDERPIRSSLGQLNNFIGGPVWADIQEVINLQLLQKYRDIESAPMEEAPGIQEAIKQLKFVLDIPNMLLEHKEEETPEEKEES